MALNLAGDGYITGLGSNQTEYGMPAGSVIHVAMNTAPNGYLKANGAAISRTTYDKLFTAIGTQFGSGDGSTTFNLPDLRGEFIRCWDDSKGTDSGRAFGSSQTATRVGTIVDARTTQQPPADTGGDPVGAGANSFVMNAYYNGGNGSNSAYAVGARPRNIALLACIKY
jgi:phage-related tail fiber protein